MDKIGELLSRRIDKIYPSKKALEKALRSGKKLRLYQGFDPSKPDLHIGHLVGLLTMKQFQDLGHEVIFLIGDFTGRVGDPTGKLKTRQALTEKQINANAKTYQEQAGMVLKFSGKNPVKMKFNSHWWKTYGSEKFLEIGNHLTVQQLIERDMFQARLKKGQPIHLSEFLYPLLQGYDSVAMAVDLEIGGTDQVFNMMMGRNLTKIYLNKEKFVVTTQLLVDSQGSKIGKTEGNAISLVSSPDQFYGQIMSLRDEAIVPCFRLITQTPIEQINQAAQDLKNGQKQMVWKKQLAFELVKMLHDQSTAQSAQKAFEQTFQKKQAVTPKSYQMPTAKANIIDVLVNSSLVQSRGQAKRLIDQGAVEVNQQVITDTKYILKSGETIRCGKHRFIKIK
ncbi:tyrosine--tRNA ligase [Patescibacteria group bacterium]|nr:tyrosine--tRNA ligase [Patescibacteria group bacterium]MBU1931730.1 tyrosine--tRNA ligase [Patescibacteria group bacterium]